MRSMPPAVDAPSRDGDEGERLVVCDIEEQPENKFHGFSTGLVARLALRSVSSCRLELLGDRKALYLLGFSGGRTRDRTLDLSRVNHNPQTLANQNKP